MNATLGGYTGYIHYMKDAAKLWYIVDPYENMYESPQTVPDYYRKIWTPFFILIVLENLILFHKLNWKKVSLSHQLTSLTHWIFHESARILFKGAEYYTYIYIYNHYRTWNLPWNSIWTWVICALGVDFCYYWVHRANHEVHFLWAQHQVHHSSEEFNLVVGLRQSVLQHWCSFIFYLPLSVFIPPSHFIAHNQLNLIYQFWIHTTVIDDLGPLEYIFNTPKHHRVHHGCNLYCLDKNYGGVLIIWDRLFGTFQEEKCKEEIIYGLVESPKSFNPIFLQTFYTKAMIFKSMSYKTWNNKLSVIYKGPSWFPGSPRLGLDEFKINVTPRPKHDVVINFWNKCYVAINFLIVIYTHFHLYNNVQSHDDWSLKILMINNICSLTTIGLLLDGYKYWHMLELLRCSFYIILLHNNFISESFQNDYITIIYSVCCFILTYKIFKTNNDASDEQIVDK